MKIDRFVDSQIRYMTRSAIRKNANRALKNAEDRANKRVQSAQTDR